MEKGLLERERETPGAETFGDKDPQGEGTSAEIQPLGMGTFKDKDPRGRGNECCLRYSLSGTGTFGDKDLWGQKVTRAA